MSAAEMIGYEVLLRDFEANKIQLADYKEKNEHLQSDLRSANAKIAVLEPIAEKVAELEKVNKILMNTLEIFNANGLDSSTTASDSESRAIIEGQKKTIATNQETITNLNKANLELMAELKGLRITITHDVLDIRKKYESDRFNGPRKIVYGVCLDVLPTFNGGSVGKTNQEFLNYYIKKFPDPNVNKSNVLRRLYELAEPKFGALIFKHADADGTTRWYLNLKPSDADLSHLRDPIISSGGAKT